VHSGDAGKIYDELCNGCVYVVNSVFITAPEKRVVTADAAIANVKVISKREKTGLFGGLKV
jgi:hypothetical protein